MRTLGEAPAQEATAKDTTVRSGNLMLALGVGALIFVPVFKVVTHLPPFMGILLGLGVLWVVSEIVNKDKDEEEKGAHSIVHALRKVDASSILFFSQHPCIPRRQMTLSYIRKPATQGTLCGGINRNQSRRRWAGRTVIDDAGRNLGKRIPAVPVSHAA